MKKLYKYITVCAIAVSVLSCTDDRDNFMVADSFCLTATDKLQTASVHTGEFAIGVSKSGKGKSSAVALLSCAEQDVLSALKLYNIQNGTSYELIPSNLYEVQGELSFSASDAVKEATLKWDAAALADYIGGTENKVIPVRLSSDDLGVNAEKNFVMVRVLRSHIRVGQTRIPRSFASDFFNPESGKKPDMKETLTLDISNNSSIRGVEIEFPFVFDNSLIAAYNASLEDPSQAFEEAPDGLVTLQTETAVMPAGKSTAQLKLTLNREMLQENGELKDFPNYLIPVRMDTEHITARKGESEFAMNGMTFGNTVTYITIRKAADGIADVGIEWGKYSDASGAWYSYISGFPADADRNLAMDDRYVYVAAFNKTAPAIYALNISDGSLAKKLDLGDAASLEYGTACVRMIPNPDGEDILSFCSLKLQSDYDTTPTTHYNLCVFAYKNGTDAKPVKILEYLIDNKGGVEDWRRYGDRYTVQGDWKSGALWFHTFSAAETNVGKTLVFPLTNGTIAAPQDPTDYIFDTAGGNKVRSVTLYPGSEQVFISSYDDAAMYSITTDDSVNKWIKWSPTSVDMKTNFAGTFSYNFFKFHNVSFMAYVRLEKGLTNDTKDSYNRARLEIIEDHCTAPEDFPSQLKAQEGLLQYPLQDATDFDAESPVKSGYYVADCTVRTINGTTYVAAMANGIGLTLFTLQ